MSEELGILREMYEEEKAVQQINEYHGGLEMGFLYAFDADGRWSAIHLWRIAGFDLFSASPWTAVLEGRHHNDVPHDPEHFHHFYTVTRGTRPVDGIDRLRTDVLSVDELDPGVIGLIHSDDSDVPWEQATDWQPWTDAPEQLRVATWEDLVDEPDPEEQRELREAIEQQHERMLAGRLAAADCPACGARHDHSEWRYFFECPSCRQTADPAELEWTPD